MLIKDLVDQVISDMGKRSGGLPESGHSELRAVLESVLNKSPWVRREEFDAQQAVLLRTREKLEQLEQRLAGLEAEESTN